MGWIFLLANSLAAILFGLHGPNIAFLASLALLATCFTTFCLIYEDPQRRANNRVNQRLAMISTMGMHAEEMEHLRSRTPPMTAEDKRFRFSFISSIFLGSGIAGIAMLCWAVAAWLL